MTVVDAVPDVAGLVRALGGQRWTGCVVLIDDERDESRLWLQSGRVVALERPGRRMALGTRLQAAGSLSPQALADARELQRTTHPELPVDEILFRTGLIGSTALADAAADLVAESLAELLVAPYRRHELRDGEPPGSAAALLDGGLDLEAILDTAAARRDRLVAALRPLGGPDATPVLASQELVDDDVVLGPAEWALLCKVDAVRTVVDLADACGFTVAEAGEVVGGLVTAGLLDLREGSGLPDWLGAQHDVPQPFSEVVPQRVSDEPVPSEAAGSDGAAAGVAPADVDTADVDTADVDTAEVDTADAAAVDTATLPVPQREMADTAALLRELSSLGGLGDEPTRPPSAAPGAQPPQSPVDRRRKRGLFGGH
ncbi:MAG: hypothetical protein EPO13_03030 [Actinomycetota bacterium]|nr:MAG: hypothetical protein EPO13_03030 [Actinomycetota bacterium]